MARRKVAEVKLRTGKTGDLSNLAFREKTIGNTTLVENLDGAGMQTSSSRAVELLGGTPLDDGNVNFGQGQLACQHQSCGAASDDDHVVFSHRETPVQ